MANKRVRRADEQARAETPAESEVRHDERHPDDAEQRAVRRDAMHAIAGAAPDVAVLVEPEAIGDAGRDRVKHPARRQTRAIVEHIEHADMAHRFRIELTAAFSDIEQALIGREGKAVRAGEIVGDQRQIAVARIEAIQRSAATRALACRLRNRC